MKLKYIFLVTAWFCVITGCDTGKSKEKDMIEVDMRANYPQKELILQDLFDIEYVRLETTDEFLTAGNVRAVGKNLIVTKNTGRTDGNFYLFDRKTGKGIKKINRLGQSGEEYTNILDIVLDEERQELFVNNHYSKKINVYDLEGNFKRSFPHQNSIYYGIIGVLDQDHLICHDELWNNTGDFDMNRNYFLIVSSHDGRLVQEIPIPYGQKVSTFIHEPNKMLLTSSRDRELVPCRGEWLLAETASDTIYKVGPDQQLRPFMVRTPSVQTDDVHFLFPATESDRYFFMHIVRKEYDFDKHEGFPRTALAYDKQERAIYQVEVYNEDFVDREPVNMSLEMFVLNLINNNGVAFTRVLSASDLVEAYKDGKLRGPLKEIAAGLDEESNPVIMIAKYKE